jgi:hypothetical protein
MPILKNATTCHRIMAAIQLLQRYGGNTNYLLLLLDGHSVQTKPARSASTELMKEINRYNTLAMSGLVQATMLLTSFIRCLVQFLSTTRRYSDVSCGFPQFLRKKKWREELVCSKWLHINKNIAYRKIVSYTNVTKVITIGKYLFKTMERPKRLAVN